MFLSKLGNILKKIKFRVSPQGWRGLRRETPKVAPGAAERDHRGSRSCEARPRPEQSEGLPDCEVRGETKAEPKAKRAGSPSCGTRQGEALGAGPWKPQACGAAKATGGRRSAGARPWPERSEGKQAREGRSETPRAIHGAAK